MPVWYDMIWYEMIYDMIWLIWYDMIWYDMIWYDMIRILIKSWYGVSSYGLLPPCILGRKSGDLQSMANSIGVNNPVHLAWVVFCKTCEELEKGDLRSVVLIPSQIIGTFLIGHLYLILRHALIRLCSLMQLPRVRRQTTLGSRQNPENSASHPRAPLIRKD